jgi:predicted PurR-regulated permease PerM
MPEDPPPYSQPAPRGFEARVGTILLMVVLFVAFTLALWMASQVLLLVFAGILLAVILRTASNALTRWTRLKPRWAVTLVLLLSVSITAAIIWLAAPQVTEQLQALSQNIQKSVKALTEQIEQIPGGEEVVERATEMQEGITDGGFDLGAIWQQVGGIFTTTFGAIAGLLVFVVIGVFLAYNPRLYIVGFLRLVPRSKRRRTCRVFVALGDTLQGWLMGQLISMAILFVSTWVMLALLGVPLAFILALLTGMLTFVPYIGPIIAAIPILMVAFIESPTLALYTGLLYLVIQNVEANVIMPLIFQRTVHLPPALSIVGQLILGGIFGVLGFILATPLTAVAMVLTQKLYVEDVLGDSMDEEVQEIPDLGDGR